MKKNIISILSILSLIFLCQLSFAKEEIYKWTDENGKLHFSEDPPPDEIESEKLRLKSSNLGGNLDVGNAIKQYFSGATVDVNDEGKRVNPKTGQEQVSSNECDVILQNLEALNSGMPIEKRNETTGEVIKLTDKARELEIQYAENFLEVYCPNQR